MEYCSFLKRFCLENSQSRGLFHNNFNYRTIFQGVMFVSCIIRFFSLYQEARHPSNQRRIVLLICLTGVAESRTVWNKMFQNVFYSNNLPSSSETYLSTEPNMSLIKMPDQNILLNEPKFGVHSNTTARALIGPKCCCFTMVQASC